MDSAVSRNGWSSGGGSGQQAGRTQRTDSNLRCVGAGSERGEGQTVVCAGHQRNHRGRYPGGYAGTRNSHQRVSKVPTLTHDSMTLCTKNI